MKRSIRDVWCGGSRRIGQARRFHLSGGIFIVGWKTQLGDNIVVASLSIHSKTSLNSLALKRAAIRHYRAWQHTRQYYPRHEYELWQSQILHKSQTFPNPTLTVGIAFICWQSTFWWWKATVVVIFRKSATKDLCYTLRKRDSGTSLRKQFAVMW